MAVGCPRRRPAPRRQLRLLARRPSGRAAGPLGVVMRSGPRRSKRRAGGHRRRRSHRPAAVLAGTVLTVRISKGHSIGKFTQFRIRRDKGASRRDRCLRPGDDGRRVSARLKAGWSSPRRRGVAVTGLAAFAAAFAIGFAATAGGGEPEAGAPAGSLAVPIGRSAPGADDLSLGRADALPALAARTTEPARAPMVSPPAPAVRAPARAARAPAPRASEVPASLPPAPAPEPGPVSPPPPEPAPAPVPAPPAPAPAPAPPAPAPEPPPVNFDDSG
jgi:hypothetical protein